MHSRPSEQGSKVHLLYELRDEEHFFIHKISRKLHDFCYPHAKNSNQNVNEIVFVNLYSEPDTNRLNYSK